MVQYPTNYKNTLSLMPKNAPLTVIAGLTRNLPSDKDSSSRLGDGGCSSAMTVKSAIVYLPILKNALPTV